MERISKREGIQDQEISHRKQTDQIYSGCWERSLKLRAECTTNNAINLAESRKQKEERWE